ncbi:DNA/RNA helicase domain-containing protein [Spiroplasma floricola]|uniref:Schlafen group 3-like DNA/RNA helicase domain-containing protein n=1 Tax=Spiroplasma floricola 23-6 TaxID=1336749 RepID=A0A2K8SE77_9MOLU|nr:DNA/RNA helicase domain-containing protein [Spiroplasma floricola]AUB31764.1 hypothetical protein SFLOR_v1c07160 [Spiroplasma floricola 23-6]
MICYEANIEDFSYDMLWKTFDEVLPDLYKIATNGEQKAWEVSLMQIAKVIQKSNLNTNVKVYLEYKFDFCESRCDVILTGNVKGVDKVLVIELKQHSTFNRVSLGNDIQLLTGKTGRGYLGSQIKRYINFFETVVQMQNHEKEFEINGVAYLHNLKRSTVIKKELQLNKNDWTVTGTNLKFFLHDEHDKFANYLNEVFQDCEKSNFIEEFEKTKNKRGFKTVEVLKNKTNEHDIVLTDVQMKLAKEVKTFVQKVEDNKKLVILEGKAGTGKTIFLYSLFLYFKNLKKYENNTFIMARNPTYVKNINLFLEQNYKFNRASSVETFKEAKDQIILFDEAQRLTMNQVTNAIKVAKTVIICLDEQQKINAKDNVTKQWIKNTFKSIDPKGSIYENTLLNQMRFLKNSEYITMVESLFSDDETFIDNSKANIHLFNNLNEMHFDINNLLKQNNKLSIKAFSINDNKFEFKTGWLNTPFSKEEIATIYYVHGLEVDYVVIYIPKGIEINNVNYISIKDKIKNNRLMTLLTRALIGAYIYCKDKNIYKIIKNKLGV